MKKRITAIAASLLIIASGLTGCIDPVVKPYSGNETGETVEKEDFRYWNEANKLEKDLRNLDVQHRDERLRSYLQEIMDRLYPEFDNLKVRLYRSPSLNAFALANGAVYVNTGMIARFESEAQIASVLAHEGAHFIRKHHYRRAYGTEVSHVASAGILLLGIPGLLAQPLIIAGMYGFSQDHENEADVEGYKRYIQAGYHPREAERAFEHLRDEIVALEIDEPFFFSTHPKIQSRIENLRSFRKALPDNEISGKIGKERFVQRTGYLRELTLKQYLSAGKYKTVILIFGSPAQTQRLPAYAPYYLGEAYRLRGEEGDDQKAYNAYMQAIQAEPDFAPASRALGLWHMKRDNHETALELFRRYRKLSPNAEDQGYIEQYIERLQNPA